jgi:hypothetical protein
MKFGSVFFCLIILFSFNCFSQTAPIKDVHITLISDSNPITVSDSLSLGNSVTTDSLLTDYYNNSIFDVGVSVLLSDTNNISKIYVKLGRTEGGSELFDNFFLFDQSSQPHGISFTRNKFYVVMELGEFSDVNELFCEVYTIKPNTASTDIFKKKIKNK